MYLVLDVSHQGSQVRVGAAVGVAQHPSLEKVFLLGIFFQRHEELARVGFLRINEIAQTLKDEDGRQLVVGGIQIDGLKRRKSKSVCNGGLSFQPV